MYPAFSGAIGSTIIKNISSLFHKGPAFSSFQIIFWKNECLEGGICYTMDRQIPVDFINSLNLFNTFQYRSQFTPDLLKPTVETS